MTKRLKITKRGVDSLKTTGKRYVAWDTEVSGFGIRVSPIGSKVYVFFYRVGGGRAGRKRWATVGKHGTITPDQAREIAQRWASKVALGGDPAEDRDTQRNAPTMNELLDRYLAEHVDSKNKPSTAQGIRQQIKATIRPAFGRFKVADIKRADIARFHSGMAHAPYTANRALALLSKAFGLAEVWGLRPDNSNPCHRVQRFKEQSRERFLSQKEFATLGNVLARAETGPIKIVGRARPVKVNPQAIHAIRLLIFTGARVSEILGLRWEWINWDAQRAELPDSKTGRKHLHLPPAALEVLRGLKQTEDGKGFVIRGGNGDDPERWLVNIKDPWALIRKAAEIEDVRLHDLRHSFASAAVASGMSLPIIGALLGHRDVKTTSKYAHLSDDPLRDAAAQVSGKISDAMKGDIGGADVIPLHRKP